MSGQVVEAPLVRLPVLELGDLRVPDHIAGVADLGDGFDGVLGPGFFAGYATTVDPELMALAIDPASAETADGVVVPLEVHRDGPSIDPFTRLVLPNGRTIRVEVDTGTHNLILATRHLADCGLSLDDPEVETTTGTDETGHHWTRHWATIAGSVRAHALASPRRCGRGPRGASAQGVRRSASTSLRTSGLLVMTPSTPRSSTVCIAAGSSTVQVWTCMPSSCTRSTYALS